MTTRKPKKDLSIKRSTRVRLARAVQQTGARTYGDFLSRFVREEIAPTPPDDPFVRILVPEETLTTMRHMTRGRGITYDDVVNAACDIVEGMESPQ